MDKEINELELLIKKAISNNSIKHPNKFLGINFKHLIFTAKTLAIISILGIIPTLALLASNPNATLLSIFAPISLLAFSVSSMPTIIRKLTINSLAENIHFEKVNKSLAILLKNHKNQDKLKEIAKDFLSLNKNNTLLMDLINIKNKIDEINKINISKIKEDNIELSLIVEEIDNSSILNQLILENNYSKR